jgi:hypothetical protein
VDELQTAAGGGRARTACRKPECASNARFAAERATVRNASCSPALNGKEIPGRLLLEFHQPGFACEFG